MRVVHSTEAGGLLFIRTIPSETCMNHKVLRERVREGEGREAMTAMLSTMSAMSKGVRKYVWTNGEAMRTKEG